MHCIKVLLSCKYTTSCGAAATLGCLLDSLIKKEVMFHNSFGWVYKVYIYGCHRVIFMAKG